MIIFFLSTVSKQMDIYNKQRFISDCPGIRAPTHGLLSSSSVFHGTYVTVSCDLSYTLIGQNILHCESGLWSERVGTCEAGK